MDPWSSVDKHRCTVQVTIFADGEARVKLLILIKGRVGEWYPFREEVQYDPRI